MAASSKQFAEVLTNVLRKSAADLSKSLIALEDEIGFALGFSGRHYIESLRRGRAPSELTDLEKLVQTLKSYQTLEAEDCEKLLRYGGHPQAHEVCVKWYAMVVDKSKRKNPSPEEEESFKPFVVGPPIKHLRQFFGRTWELKRLSYALQHAPLEHVAILGARRSGKSSLLHYLMHTMTTEPLTLRPGQQNNWLNQPGSYRWGFIDFQNARMQRQEVLLRRLLTLFAIEIPEPCTLDTFMEAVDLHPLETPTVVLLDEIGEGLAAPELDLRFWNSLRALLNDAGNGKLSFVVASHLPPTELAETHSRTSPFFNMFTTLQLGPFTESEARELVGNSPIPFAEADVQWILQQSRLWPILLQCLCQERLVALELSNSQDAWKQAGLQRIEHYRHLLQQPG